MIRKSILFLFVLLLLLGCASAEELSLKVAENIQPYADNQVAVTVPAEGLLSVWLEDGVMDDVYYCYQTPVSSGTFTLSTDACTPDGAFLPRGDYEMVASLLSETGQGYIASAKVHVMNPKAKVLFAVPDTDTIVPGQTKIRFELCLSRETDLRVLLQNDLGQMLRTWNIHREGLAESVFTFDGTANGKPLTAGQYQLIFAIRDGDPNRISVPFTVLEEAIPDNRSIFIPETWQDVTFPSGNGLLLVRDRQLAVLYRAGEMIDYCFADSSEIPEGCYPFTSRKYTKWEGGNCYLYNLLFGDGYIVSQQGFRNIGDTSKRDFGTDVDAHKQNTVCLAANSENLSAWKVYSVLSIGDSVIVTESLGGAFPFPVVQSEKALLPDTQVTLTFVGDCVLGSEEKTRPKENSFDSVLEANDLGYPFRNVQDYFQSDDLTVINLECVLKDDASGKVEKTYNFRGPTRFASVLPVSGVDLCNIANNHYIDYGTAGRSSTRAALEAVSVPYSGYRTLYVYEKNGFRIGFAGIRETTYKQNPSYLRQEIKALRAWGCDAVVYTAHFGNEYERLHNSLQIKIAHEAIDAGANLVIGAHPHVVQGLEAYHGGVIFYSLGNFVFGGNLNLTEFDGLLVQTGLCFTNGAYQGTTVSLVPVLTTGAMPANDFSPVPAEGEDFDRIMDKIGRDTDFEPETFLFFPSGS